MSEIWIAPVDSEILDPTANPPIVADPIDGVGPMTPLGIITSFTDPEETK